MPLFKGPSSRGVVAVPHAEVTLNRSPFTIAGNVIRTTLEQREAQVCQQRGEVGVEAGGERTVDDAMVVRKREREH